MNEKEITLSFDLEQVANDILTKCNQISKTVRDEALDDIRADIQEPDSPESRSIINRALTEAFGDLKMACQRYLKTGRTEDNNLLERMVSGVTYTAVNKTVQVFDESDRAVYIAKVSNVNTEVYRDGDKWKAEDGDAEVTPDVGTTVVPKTTTVTETTNDVDSIQYETVTMVLYIPNFNVSVTAALESNCHKYLVQYVMSEFLSDELADKGAEYREKANLTYGKILKNLTSRDRFNMRKPSWI